MYDGILIQTPEFSGDKEGDEKQYRFAIAVGKLTEDPEIRSLNMTRTTFNIKYHTKSYLNVVLWGDTVQAQAAQCLKAGDVVLVIGTITRSYYTSRKGVDKGKKKEWRDLNCQFVCAMPWVLESLRMQFSPSIQNLINSEESDVLESAEDHLEEDEYGGYGTEYDEDTEYDDDEDIGL